MIVRESWIDPNTAPAPFRDGSFSGSGSESDAELKPSIWWQALYSRDQRFDGRFFVGAATTGIYCRPICPVPFAKPNNLVWFACAAAAEAGGFRPCRRCRPETSPGTPAWLGTSTIVSRALRLISEGALDKGGVEDLAGHVGVGSRQLRRLFVEHLGASPVKVAITHRVHFARNLIEETDLPITNIALSAGFTSIRQFNHAVRAICGQPPTALRRARGECPRSPHGGLLIRLPYRPPLDWAALAGFLRPRAIPGVELAGDGVYRRTISVGGAAGVIEVRPDKSERFLSVRIELPGYRHLMKVVERVRRIFDLGADPLCIANDLARDERLKPLLDRRPGLRVPGVWDGFELAVHAVLSQQLTIEDSTRLAGYLVTTFGKPFHTSVSGLTHLFPAPEDLIDADLSKVGIHKAQAATLQALARSVHSGRLTFSASTNLQDAITRFCVIQGVEENTAHYIAMRALGEPDAFPLGGRGFRNGPGNLCGPISPSELMEGAECWRPWRAYAAMHLCTAAG
jgi:AraC family transcriptional regulator of adaptative response / DNA-3-methyladenine glycosylase II